MRTHTPAITAFAALALAASASAQIINGDFSGGLTGWSTTGDVSVLAGRAFLTTASATQQDDPPAAAGNFNFSGIDAVASSGTLDLFAGLPLDALDPNPGSLIYAFEGSGLKQSFNVGVGDILKFDWILATNDPGPDYAFFSLNGVLNVLADSSAATNPSVPFLFSTVANTYTSAPFATAGLVTLAFGVVDVNDFNGTTALSIDKVLLLSAPEPSLTLLCTMGALAVATRRRRQA